MGHSSGRGGICKLRAGGAGRAATRRVCWRAGAAAAAPHNPPDQEESAMNGQQWYVAVAGQQQGPMSTADVNARLRAGQLDRSAHVFTQGMASWETIGSRAEFAEAFAAPAAAAAPAYAAARPAASVAHEIDYE